VPFVSKAIGIPIAKLACRILLGEPLADLELPVDTANGHVCVKEAVLPFDRFAGADSLLGPEMRSTGEVMGIARDFPTAFAKAQAAAGSKLPGGGTVFITVADGDKQAAIGIAMTLHDLGFEIIATRGTAQAIRRMGIPVETINKIGEGSPHVVDWIERGGVDLVINTPVGTGARADGYEIRAAAIARRIPCITTMAGGMAAARAIGAARGGEPEVLSLQEIHARASGIL
jgi:carbamoyl-phosphate synthase large subunit